MFIGHYAAGFALKSAAPRASLGWFILGASLSDLIFPLLVLTDGEHARIDPGNTAFTPLDLWDYPWSHSLLTNLGWALLLGGIHFLIRRDRRSAVLIGLAVLSHWVLDFVSHRPDMPLWPGGPLVGLGLWNSIPATIAIESLLFFASVVLYLRATRPRDAVGRWSLAVMLGLLALSYLGSAQGTPPPNTMVMAWVGMASWLWVFWGAWIDRHRVSVAS